MSITEAYAGVWRSGNYLIVWWSRCFALIGISALLFATNVRAQHFEVPFKGEDLADNEKIYWGRAKHSDPGHIQEHGYDLGAMRYDNTAKKWTEKTVSDQEYTKNPQNKHWLIYDKRIYAMQSGKVVACWRNAPENPKPEQWHSKIGEGYVYGGGNGFWIEHSDGSRVEYAHMIPGSPPSGLCPHNDVYMPSKIASPDVSDAWTHLSVPASQQATVSAGQFLGKVGNAGTSSAPHLHIHLQKSGASVKINFARGMSAPVSNNDRFGKWTSFATKPIPPGPILVWPAHSLVAEHSRHGFPAEGFQAMFDHLTNSGFWPEWIDAYNVGGKNYLNFVWRPAQGEWRAHFLVDDAKHQSNIDEATKGKFWPVFVDSSVSGGQALYTAIFVKHKPGSAHMRHGLSYEEHEKEMNSAKKAGLAPVNISVVSLNNKRWYTVLYRSQDVGLWEVKSQIAESNYQSVYDTNKAAGRRPIYLNAYVHNGQPYISAVFAEKISGQRKDRHDMSAAEYQTEVASAVSGGLLTRAVTSFDGAQSSHRYAASWWK